MKTKNEILKWLRANLGRRAVAALTHHDMDALFASVAMTPLVSHAGSANELFKGYHAVVMQMQEHTRWLAYHTIAMELDWGHRDMIWMMAETVTGIPFYEQGFNRRPAMKCAWEPGGGGQAREDELKKQK